MKKINKFWAALAFGWLIPAGLAVYRGDWGGVTPCLSSSMLCYFLARQEVKNESK